MIEVHFLIPMADNSGQTFTPEHDLIFEMLLTETFGAYTRLPGLTDGKWNDAGITYPDQCRMYLVAVTGLIGSAQDILATVAFAKAHYGQLAIYLRYLNVAEIV